MLILIFEATNTAEKQIT